MGEKGGWVVHYRISSHLRNYHFCPLIALKKMQQYVKHKVWNYFRVFLCYGHDLRQPAHRW